MYIHLHIIHSIDIDANFLLEVHTEFDKLVRSKLFFVYIVCMINVRLRTRIFVRSGGGVLEGACWRLLIS